MRERIAIGLLVAALAGCDAAPPAVHLGTPAGPYRLAMTLTPAAPVPAAPAQIALTLTQEPAHTPVADPQIVHERALHTFIVARDFSSFAHLHHEDFAPRTDAERSAGVFHFPYVFPHAGDYRVVSEFVHRDRAWSKRFDLRIGGRTAPPAAPAAADLARERRVGTYVATLSVSPAQPVAGHEVELVVTLARDDRPVSDLKLWLGAETHLALWREDGAHFGHSHSYTPAMARMMEAMQSHRMDAAHSAAMMLEMMKLPATLEYPGPRVPVRHTFPAPGRYRLFFQFAPGGESLVLPFALDVAADDGRLDTHIDSIVKLAGAIP